MPHALPPKLILLAFGLNLAGLGLLAASLLLAEPWQLLATLVLGTLAISAGFLLWAALVVAEARGKRLFD